MQIDLNVVQHDEGLMRYSHSVLYLLVVRVKTPLQRILRMSIMVIIIIIIIITFIFINHDHYVNENNLMFC
jgi:hypothetical protein